MGDATDPTALGSEQLGAGSEAPGEAAREGPVAILSWSCHYTSRGTGGQLHMSLQLRRRGAGVPVVRTVVLENNSECPRWAKPCTKGFTSWLFNSWKAELLLFSFSDKATEGKCK
jgi:hypothetical protein